MTAQISAPAQTKVTAQPAIQTEDGRRKGGAGAGAGGYTQHHGFVRTLVPKEWLADVEGGGGGGAWRAGIAAGEQVIVVLDQSRFKFRV